MAFGMKKTPPPAEMNTASSSSGNVDTGINVYLGAGTSFEGRLEFTGTAQISGAFKGEVVSQGILSVGQGGQVQGEAKVAQLNVAGTFNGSAICSRKAVLQRSADYEGELHTPKLEMEDGAKFEGHISMPVQGTKALPEK